MWRVYNLHHTSVFTYSHANTPLGQSERAYYLSYFIKTINFVMCVYEKSPERNAQSFIDFIHCNYLKDPTLTSQEMVHLQVCIFPVHLQHEGFLAWRNIQWALCSRKRERFFWNRSCWDFLSLWMQIQINCVCVFGHIVSKAGDSLF